jgi:hypothetical protein
VILRPEASLEGFGGGWGGDSLQTVHFTRGMLLVAATDPATGNALWQGMSSTVIGPRLRAGERRRTHQRGGREDVRDVPAGVSSLFPTT